jgi:hypothetical protein
MVASIEVVFAAPTNQGRNNAQNLKQISAHTFIFSAALGIGVAHAAAVGDTCGSASSPTNHPGRWYNECLDLAVSCATDVHGGYLECDDFSLGGGCVGGTCVTE